MSSLIYSTKAIKMFIPTVRSIRPHKYQPNWYLTSKEFESPPAKSVNAKRVWEAKRIIDSFKSSIFIYFVSSRGLQKKRYIVKMMDCVM